MTTPFPSPPGAVRFVIFAAPRTGSNLLCGLLNSHPNIVCHHGLFNPDGVHYALDHRDGSLDFGSRGERDRDPAVFLDQVWRNALGMAAVGFKFNHGEDDLALQLLIRDPLVRKILLSRGNRVRAYVSALEAAATGQWESYGVADVIRGRQAVHVDPAGLWKYVNASDDFYASLRESLSTTRQSFFSVDYESLGSPVEMGKLLRFLDMGACRLTLTAPSYKRGSQDLNDLVVNFAELAAALRGSALEDELFRRDAAPIFEVPIGRGTTGDERPTRDGQLCHPYRS
jgi:LPS sulfotransferase NodH